MPDFTSAQVQVNLPTAQKTPYQRVDFFQAAHVGTDFVVSCFQLDYQDVMTKQVDPARGTQMVATEAIPIARLLMNKEGFERLRAELNALHDKVPAE